MQRHVALLRGINVGKHKRIAMADLRALFRHLGYLDVTTHLNSGNVMFTPAHECDTAALVHEMETAIADGFGIDVPVILRSGAEMARIVEQNPFPEATTDHATLHVAFLGEEPAPDRVASLASAERGPDDYRILGRETYLHYPNRLTGAVFKPDGLERALAVPVTLRNWRTVVALAEMVRDCS
jgi:uncharacterized protein (DUF1697 family)